MLAGMAEQRCNDACVDSAGRFWIGSVTSDKANPAATLYRLDPDGSLRAIFGGLLTSNGAAFSPDGRTFYHADTPRSEEHTSELQSLMRISYAVFCLINKTTLNHHLHS